MPGFIELRLVLKLSALERFDSKDDLCCSSSVLMVLTDGGLPSVRTCRRGGGAIGGAPTLRACVLLCEAERLRAADGGVGGCGCVWVVVRDSGTLPAASRSNTLWAASVLGVSTGGGGRGLLTSDSDVFREWLPAGGELECEGGDVSSTIGTVISLGLFGTGSLPSSILMSFPWRELGGGGFLRPKAALATVGGDESIGGCRSSASSGSDISCEVRGVSCMASKMD
jgi:hypothetical protein